MATYQCYVNTYLYYQLVVEESSVDQINNTSVVSWYVQVGRSNSGYESNYTWSYSVNIGGRTASGSQKAAVTHDPVTVGYGSFTIEHNSDGSGSVACSASISSSRGSGDVGGTITLTTIPRASSISAPTFTLGQPGTITITPAASGFKHTIRWYYGKDSGTVVEKTANTSISWTPDITLAKWTPNATSGVGTLRCATYSGDTEIGTKDISLYCSVPSDLVPTLSDITLTPVNENEIVSGWGLYVKGLTKVKVAADASGVQESTIVSVWYSVTGLGSKKSDLTFESAPLVSLGTVSISAQAVDSRGRTSNVVTKTIEVLDYVKPTLSGVELFRCDETGKADDSGQYIYAKATATYSDVGGNNTFTLAIQYQKTDSSSTSSITLESGVGQIIGDGKVSYAASYVATITLLDTMQNSATYTVTIPSDHVSFNLRPGGNGGSFGSYAEKDDVLSVEWNLNVKQDINADGSISTAGDITAEGTVNAVSGLKVNGTAVSDFVIASNISTVVNTVSTNSWSYIKWKNGNAIAWMTINAAYANANVLLANPWFPFTFDTSYSVVATINDTGGNSSESLPRNVKVGKLSDSRISIVVHSTAGGFTSSTTMPISVQIMGKWTQ